MTPEQVREIVEEICEAFFNPHAARRWVESKHPRDKSGKFASGGGGGGEGEMNLAKAEKYLRVAEKYGKSAAKKRAKAEQLKVKADALHVKVTADRAAFKAKYGYDPIEGKKRRKK